jgi:hypothetical protein
MSMPKLALFLQQRDTGLPDAPSQNTSSSCEHDNKEAARLCEASTSDHSNYGKVVSAGHNPREVNVSTVLAA